MEFIDVLNKRQSTRKFQNTEILKEIVDKIIKLAQLGPSAGNLQSYKLIITKNKLTNIDAPLNLIVCANQDESAERYGERGRNLYSIQDATIFASYFQLVIVEMGLASIWIGTFNENKLREILKLDNDLKPVVIIPFGYATSEYVERPIKNRKSIEEIVRWI